MTMGKRALILHCQNNSAEKADVDAWVRGLDSLGFTGKVLHVRKLSPNLDVSGYDFIGIFPSYNALFTSGKGRASAIENVFEHARPGALHLIVCDTSLPIAVSLWDESPEDRRNVFSSRADLRVLGAFSPDILQDESAMERVEKLWMGKVHQGAEFVPLNWSSFHYLNLGRFAPPRTKTPVPTLGRFYYGMNKPAVVPGLRSLGLGEGPDDGLFGKIRERFPEVRDLTRSDNDWRRFAASARQNLVPFEPIKMEYQLTLRLLELQLLNRESMTFDSRVSDYVRQGSTLPFWEAEKNRALGEVSGLLA